MAHLAQGLGLDLADALAGNVEILADFLQGVIGLLIDPKTLFRTLPTLFLFRF